jgi:acetylornithine deacetylase
MNLDPSLYPLAVGMLKAKIAIPAPSGAERAAADYLTAALTSAGAEPFRIGNNVCACSKHNRGGQKTLMLNSHIDTVAAAAGYTRPPHEPAVRDGKLFGLGSNDAGASVVALAAAFLSLSRTALPFNLLLALSCEEENSGAGGMARIVGELPPFDCALVGEPTGMKAAIGERGLLVVDGTAFGTAGHAARNEGVNAIYRAMDDIEYIRRYRFEKISPLMGAVQTNVTQIHAGTQHNVVPDRCTFVVDIRPNECYGNSEILATLQAGVGSELRARSLHHTCSFTPEGHPLRLCAERLAIPTYVSPTTSDWVRLPVPALKMGPGDSARSHSADEFVYLHEIEDAIHTYIRFLLNLKL